jgi:Late exocytosis, associated with Golgi transport/Cytosolic domain of 10TM putative phosphate transporter
MCFKVLAVLTLIMFGVLIPVNYYAGSRQLTVVNTTKSETLVQGTTDSLSFFSISHVQNSSNLLWLHLIFTYLVSGIVLKFLYDNYEQFANTLVEHVGKGAHSASERFEHRTVLIKNLKGNLSFELGLQEWLDSLRIGKVEKICMNTSGGYELYNLLNNHETSIRKLESAYMQWALNVFRHLSKVPLYQAVNPISRMKESTKIYLHHTKLSPDEEVKYWTIIQRQRPLLIRTVNNRIVQSDMIRHYGKLESVLVEELFLERNKAGSSEHSSASKKKLFGPRSVSAFVTFESIRSSMMARQLLLHSEMGAFKVKITQAPPRNEVIWSNLTMPSYERLVRHFGIISLSTCISIFWVIPTYYVSSLTDLAKLALDPAFTGYVEYLTDRPELLTFVTSFGPPVIIQTANSLMPYLFDCKCP